MFGGSGSTLVLIELSSELCVPEEETLITYADTMLVDLRTHAKGEACCVTQPPNVVVLMKGLDHNSRKGWAAGRLRSIAIAVGGPGRSTGTPWRNLKGT